MTEGRLPALSFKKEGDPIVLNTWVSDDKVLRE